MFHVLAPSPQTWSRSRPKTQPGGQFIKRAANIWLILSVYPPLMLWCQGGQHLPLVLPKLFPSLCSSIGQPLFGQVIKSIRTGRCSMMTLWLLLRSRATWLLGCITQRRGKNPELCYKKFPRPSTVGPTPAPAHRCRPLYQAMRDQGETLGTSLLYTLHFSQTEWDRLNLSSCTVTSHLTLLSSGLRYTLTPTLFLCSTPNLDTPFLPWAPSILTKFDPFLFVASVFEVGYRKQKLLFTQSLWANFSTV